MTVQTLALGMPGGWEWVLIAGIGLLIFGRRLPEVGRNIGKSIVEFKRGIKDVSDEIDRESQKPADEPRRIDTRAPADADERVSRGGPAEAQPDKTAGSPSAPPA